MTPAKSICCQSACRYQSGISIRHLTQVLDLGCGEGSLLCILLNNVAYSRLAGVDCDLGALAQAAGSCQPSDEDFTHLRELPVKVDLYHGSIDQSDDRLADFDAITCLEVIEHLPAEMLAKFPQVVFGEYSPKTVIISTPNAEYNVHFASLMAGTETSKFRHDDHKFEWTRCEFQNWYVFIDCRAESIGRTFGYSVRFTGVGRPKPALYTVGFCTQIAIFERISEKRSLFSSRDYQLVRSIEYPFFEEVLTDDQLLVEMKSMCADTALYHMEFQRDGPVSRLSIEISALWNNLRVRQLFKHKDKVVSFLIGKKIGVLSDESDIMNIDASFLPKGFEEQLHLNFADMNLANQEHANAEEASAINTDAISGNFADAPAAEDWGRSYAEHATFSKDGAGW